MKNLNINDEDTSKKIQSILPIDGTVLLEDNYEDELCEFDNNFDFDDILYDLKDSIMDYINKQGLPLCEYMTLDDLRVFLLD
jgi:hypothetical protein